jgi:hypothetical protein
MAGSMTAGLGELTCLLHTAVTAPTAVRAFRLSTQGEPHQPSLPNERRVAVGQGGPRVGWTCGRERRDRRIPKDTGIEPVRVQGEHAFVELLRASAASRQSTRVGQIPSGGVDSDGVSNVRGSLWPAITVAGCNGRTPLSITSPATISPMSGMCRMVVTWVSVRPTWTGSSGTPSSSKPVASTTLTATSPVGNCYGNTMSQNSFRNPDWIWAAMRFLEPDVASIDASGKRSIRGIAPNRWSPRPWVM